LPDAVISADAAGVGGTERISHQFRVADWYGLVVYNQNSAGGSYKIRLIDPGVSGVEAAPPVVLDLSTVTANPFTNAVTLRLAIPKAAAGDLSIYDVQGRQVRTPVSGALQPGVHLVVWDGANERGEAAPAGLYLARLKYGDRELREKLIRAW